MDSATLARMFDYIAQQDINLHSLFIVRNGYTIVEAYSVSGGADLLRSTRSCGKSFTGALVGIAIAEGYIEGIDQPVLDFFPDFAATNNDPRKEAMTIEHLLTMTSGFDWPETSASYGSSSNIMNQMMRSGNWAEFVLERPTVADPGTRFNYSSGDSHLLSAIISEATGMSMQDFAREQLYRPLGIPFAIWMSDPQGNTFGAGGIRITTRDMARFGQLYLQGGRWGEQQVVPAEWVAASTAQQTGAHGAASYYGYQWWVRGNGIYAAHGYRGQRIFVVPHLDMVVIFTANLDGSAPSVVLTDYIIPAAWSAEPLPENPQGIAALQERIEGFTGAGLP